MSPEPAQAGEQAAVEDRCIHCGEAIDFIDGEWWTAFGGAACPMVLGTHTPQGERVSTEPPPNARGGDRDG